MKRILLFTVLAMGTIAFVSCNKDKDGGSDQVLDASISLSEEIPDALTYGEPVSIVGTISSSSDVTTAVVTGVSGSEGNYTAAGDPQSFAISNKTLNLLFFPDSKNITAIEVVLSGNGGSKTFYYPVSSVTGDLKGSAWVNPNATLYANNKVETYENSPETYPTPNTGASSPTISFFSMHGTPIGGEKKHLLSLDDLRSVDGLNASMSFVNVLQNTRNNAYIGGQRGYMFTGCLAASLGGGDYRTSMRHL